MIYHCSAYDKDLLIVTRTMLQATRLEGVDKINNEVVACYLDVEGACYGNENFT